MLTRDARNQQTIETRAAHAGLWLATAAIVALALPTTDAQRSDRRGGVVSDAIDPQAAANLIPGLDVQDKNLQEICRYIEEKANVNIIVAQDLQDTNVTLRLNKPMSWMNLLKVLADTVEADLRVITEDTVKLELPPKVILEFRDVPVKDAIHVIARVSAKNIVIPDIPEVDSFITINLRNVAWDDALDVVVKSAGLVAVPDANGKVIRIAHPRDLQRQLETELFRLRHLQPEGEYRAIFSTGGNIGTGESDGGGGGRTFVERTKLKKADKIEDRFPLLTALRKALTVDERDKEIGRLDYDELTNTIIVRDQRTNINDIAHILEEIDTEPSEVQIDLKFVDTENVDLLDVGVDIFSDGLNVSFGLGSFTHRLPFNLGEGGFEDSLQIHDVNDAIAAIDPASTYTFGTLDFTGVNAALRILKRDVHTKVVQAPKVVALSGRPATIFVGDEIRYAESEAIINELGNPTVTIAEAENSPVQVGFQLLVIPNVIIGTNKIKMTCIPANTSLTGPFNGFDRFQVGVQTLDLPRLTSSTVVTHMIVQNGQTAIIGGLYSEIESNSTNKVPVLGDLPLVGYGFKNRVVNSDRSNLIIFITPRIVREFEETEGYLEQYIKDRNVEHGDEVEELTSVPYIPPPPEVEETTEGAAPAPK